MTNMVNCEFYQTWKRGSEKIMICFGQIRQTNKSLTYCIYKNGNITKIYFCFPCSNGGVLVIMRTITSVSFWSGWSGDGKYIICFATNSNFAVLRKHFRRSRNTFCFIFAKFKYFAKQIIYLESPDHVLQNDIWYVHILRVWNFFELPKMA